MKRLKVTNFVVWGFSPLRPYISQRVSVSIHWLVLGSVSCWMQPSAPLCLYLATLMRAPFIYLCRCAAPHRKNRWFTSCLRWDSCPPSIFTFNDGRTVPVKLMCATFLLQFNFVGRILGPRGMTAKQLEQETGCKIMVRGRGSMRDKKKVSRTSISFLSTNTHPLASAFRLPPPFTFGWHHPTRFTLWWCFFSSRLHRGRSLSAAHFTTLISQPNRILSSRNYLARKLIRNCRHCLPCTWPIES